MPKSIKPAFRENDEAIYTEVFGVLLSIFSILHFRHMILIELFMKTCIKCKPWERMEGKGSDHCLPCSLPQVRT